MYVYMKKPLVREGWSTGGVTRPRAIRSTNYETSYRDYVRYV